MMKTSDLSCCLFLTAMMLTAACDPGAPVDSKAVKEEIQSRKIRKVSASDIMMRALTTGEAIQAEVTVNIWRLCLPLRRVSIDAASHHCLRWWRPKHGALKSLEFH